MTSPMSATSSISGLMSGLDTASIVSQLMQIEAQPQNLLKRQLSNVQTDAAAYRDVNTSFAALASAAAALTQPANWTPTKATSSDSTVTASTTSGAQAGSITFSVDKLAVAHSMISNQSQKWADTTTAFGLGTITLTKTSDNSTVSITPTDTDGNGTISLAEAVDAINKQAPGYTASMINTGSGYQLSIGANATGLNSVFTVGTSSGSTTFSALTQGQDAQITLGGAGGATPTAITSSTNTFSGVLTGTTFTVSQTTPTGGALSTVSVTSDPDAVANKMQAMVDAANAALAKIKQYTDSSSGSTAPLKGDWSLISLGGQILDAVSTAVSSAIAKPTDNTSAGGNGLQLTKDGTLTFDKSAFKTALAANPALVQSIFGGTVGDGADGAPNTADDTLDVDGIAGRLQTLANQASDSAVGSLTSLANGEDTTAKDLQSQIDDWDTRLALRQQTLSNQFNAMESALGTLKGQASWLTSQINALPGFSSSSKS